jgi:acetyl esterase/lipase
MKTKFIALILFSMLIQLVPAQKTEMIEYKAIDTTKLTVKVFYPENFETKDKFPAMVFYFGGGWITRAITQFETQSRYFAQRGMVCFIVDYRVTKTDKTTPFESLMDAKSAMRFIKSNAKRFHLDTNKIVASGGSAGGHLAAATALIAGYNDPKDNLKISTKPNALVLFNPVIDNGPGGYGNERILEKYTDFSPLHNIVKGAPPTIIFLGEKDDLIPMETMKNFKKKMEEVGSRCELLTYPEQKHGFFNKPMYKNNTMYEADKFLISIGFLTGEPTIKIE